MTQIEQTLQRMLDHLARESRTWQEHHPQDATTHRPSNDSVDDPVNAHVQVREATAAHGAD
jgi:hypothetical protein